MTAPQDPQPQSEIKGCPEDLPPGLRYVDDSRPGYTREWKNGAFICFNTQGNPLSDDADIKRINALAIPPAYTNVWICPDSRGHLQATGRDARGRKQYRYHPAFREVRESTKYEHVVAFAKALPEIGRASCRERV